MFDKIFGESDLQRLFRNGKAFNWTIGVISTDSIKLRLGSSEVTKPNSFIALAVNFRDNEIVLEGDLMREYRIPQFYRMKPMNYGDLLYEGSIEGEDVTTLVISVQRKKLVLQSIRRNFSFNLTPTSAQRIDNISQ